MLLSLPGLEAELPCTGAQELVLVGGGRPPALSWFSALLSAVRQDRTIPPVWAIDRGVNLCRSAAVCPALLIGDGDSADGAAWAWAAACGAKVHRYPPKKDDTDTALALQAAAHLSPAPCVILTAAFGGRLDHLFSTAALCAHSPVPCVLADACETLFYLHDGESLIIRCVNAPHAVSLLPLTDECTGVTTRRLYWELTDAAISHRTSTTISNVLAPGNTSHRFSVSVARGVLGVYLCHQE